MNKPPLISRREAMGYICGGMVALGTGGCIQYPRQQEPSTEINHRFNLETYTPPKEGVIIAQRVKNPEKRTVLYLPDQHPYKTRPIIEDNQWFTALKVQQELYFIVKDLIERGIQVPLMIEHWESGQTLAEYQQYLASLDRPALEENGKVAILKILQEKDLIRRKILTEEYALGHGPVLAGDVLAATYPETIVPFGLKSADSNDKSDRLGLRFRQFVHAHSHPETAQCTDVTGTIATLREVLRRFVGGVDRSASTVDCYCSFRQNADVAVKEFFHERTVVVAQKEIDEVMAYKGNSNVVVVIAGSGHMSEAVNTLEQHDVNYFVIAPRAIETVAREQLETGLSLPKEMLRDDEAGTCRSWEGEERNGTKWKFNPPKL